MRLFLHKNNGLDRDIPYDSTAISFLENVYFTKRLHLILMVHNKHLCNLYHSSQMRIIYNYFFE